MTKTARGAAVAGHGDATSPNEASPAGTIRDGARETGPALESWYRFLLWLVPTLERFPRRQKFLLGDRIQGAALDVLESLVEATYTRNRESHLARANLLLHATGWPSWPCGFRAARAGTER